MQYKPPLILLAAVAALPPLAVDMYLPAIPQIAEIFGTSIELIQNSLSVFLVGFGFGMLVFAPFSDRLGRRPLCLFGLLGFALSSFLITLSDSATSFLLYRLLQGLLGSAATVTIPAVIRDCYGKHTAKGMSSVFMIMLVAPMVAPLMGSLLLQLSNWKIIFQVLAVYPLLLFALIFWRLRETRPEDAPDAAPRSFLGNYRIILANRDIYLDLFCFMLSALAFFTYLTSVSFIYIAYYGVSETLFGVLFGCTAFSLVVANVINVRLVSRFGPRRMLHGGQCSGVLFSLALMAVTLLDMNVYWTLGCFIFIVGSLGIISINADALVLLRFPHQASSASAVTGTLRFGFGAAAGPILSLIYTGTPLPIAIMLLVTLSLAGGLQLLQLKRQGGYREEPGGLAEVS